MTLLYFSHAHVQSNVLTISVYTLRLLPFAWRTCLPANMRVHTSSLPYSIYVHGQVLARPALLYPTGDGGPLTMSLGSEYLNQRDMAGV
jgi:hypothetical protein